MPFAHTTPRARRARGTGRAIAREAVFESRVVVGVSSSVVRLGHTGISRNAATNRKRSGPYRTATRGVPERSGSGDLRTCLVAFPRCDAAAGRPGGCEHFPCLGHSCMTPGRAINQRGERCRVPPRRHHETPIRALAFVLAAVPARATRGRSVERLVGQRPRALVLFPISLGGLGAPTRLGGPAVVEPV